MSTVIEDPSSLANLSEVVTKHLHLDWTISFDQRNITGHVLLDMVTRVDNVAKIVLDTSYISVKSASLAGQDLKVYIER